MKILIIVPIVLAIGLTAILLRNTASANGQALSNTAEDGQLSLLDESSDPDRTAFVADYWLWIFSEAGIPERIARGVSNAALESPAFVMELLAILQQDPYTFALVDKQFPLPYDYAPDDLVSLGDLSARSYRITRNDLSLRRMVVDALQEMATAATADGVVLSVGSSYRSAPRQAEIYSAQVRAYGQEAADRQSARAGHSQHQLGLTLDFSPIEDSFAETAASKWLIDNASRFGFSLSFPNGYEEVTGYRWESWHYRYVGKDLAAFINEYFEGIQQYALQFIKVWLERAGNS